MSVAKPNPHDSGPIHVSGVARYTDDIPLADPVHLAFGLSTVAHARLTSVNLDAVRAAVAAPAPVHVPSCRLEHLPTGT